MISEELKQVYKLLFERFGQQHWWPGESRFEVIVGAVLTQNTNWTNVERAIANLKTASSLEPEKLHTIKIERLAELIRPAGYFNIKARRLKNLIDWLFENYDGKLENIDAVATGRLRDELLSVTGIGPETADSILLYAFDRPVFVVDAYTARIAARHNFIEPPFDYTGLQRLFADNLEEDVKMFNEFHALFVRCGKEYCRPNPKCTACPLEILPHRVETR
jgi:endonuclease III related protein